MAKTETTGFFGRLMGDIVGISDIAGVVDPKDYDKTISDDMVDESEEIFMLLKSKKGEHCFAARSIVVVEGEMAASSRRLISRYKWEDYYVHDIKVETAGTVDLDVELKFKLTNMESGDTKEYSIDIARAWLDSLVKLSKFLGVISKKQKREARSRHDAEKVLESVGRIVFTETKDEVSAVYENLYRAHHNNMENNRTTDFSDYF